MNKYIVITGIVLWGIVCAVPVSAGGKVQDGRVWVFDTQGRLLSLSNTKELKRDGFDLHFYDNGFLRRNNTYQKDQLEGFSRGYYENGRTHYSQRFKAGVRQGRFERFYPDGQVWMEVGYKDGRPHGLSIVLSSAGLPQQVVEYQHGRIMLIGEFDRDVNLILEK